MAAAAPLLPAGPGDRGPQEQLRPQGQQLRLPRELPDGPRGARSVADRDPRDAALRHAARSSPARARSAPRRRARPRRGAVPAHPARRLLRGGGRARDHAEAADRQHPRRAARRRAEVPPPARHRRRRQPVRGRHVPQGRHDRARAVHDRGRLPAPRPRRSAAPVQALRQVSYDLSLARPLELADGTDDDRARDAVGVLRPGREVRRGARPRGGRRAEVGADLLRRWEDVLTGLETDPMSLSPTSSTGSPSTGSSTATASATACDGTTPAGGDGPPVPRPAAGEVPRRPASGSSASPPTPRSSSP